MLTDQGDQLAAVMTAPVEFVRFTQAEGAGREVFGERVFPWLDNVLRTGAAG